jgi:hypothetical protein
MDKVRKNRLTGNACYSTCRAVFWASAGGSRQHQKPREDHRRPLLRDQLAHQETAWAAWSTPYPEERARAQGHRLEVVSESRVQ